MKATNIRLGDMVKETQDVGISEEIIQEAFDNPDSEADSSAISLVLRQSAYLTSKQAWKKVYRNTPQSNKKLQLAIVRGMATADYQHPRRLFKKVAYPFTARRE